ncbi:MAG: adenylyltransferase/cytidyltransferase family protein [Clostridia bacterium]|nr:adenylyltransferase/cytidyltransferase family protein [Clostridia bacterium]
MKIKKIGGFAGKFLPPHIGHITEIENSAKLCDVLYVVVADNTENSKMLCAKAGIPFIPVKLRIKWLKNHFKNNPKIKIIYMCEDGLPKFPDGMKIWSDKFKEITHHKVNMKFADETYRELNEKYFPECEFVCFDRHKINISATTIRENPEKYIDYIIPEAREFFENLRKRNNE